MEFSDIFKSECGVEVEMRIKAECPSDETKRKALSFLAQSSHQFYIEAAKRLNSKP